MHANGHENLTYKIFIFFHTALTKCNCTKDIPFHSFALHLVFSLPAKHELNGKHSSYLHLCIPLIVCYNLTTGSNSKVLSALFLHSYEKDIFLFANN